MMNAEITLALVRARDDDRVRAAARRLTSVRADDDPRAVQRPLRHRGPAGAFERAILLARARELVSLAARSGYGPDDLVRMIQRLS
jgi:hypothetical protein